MTIKKIFATLLISSLAAASFAQAPAAAPKPNGAPASAEISTPAAAAKTSAHKAKKTKGSKAKKARHAKKTVATEPTVK
jgi:hypothetical protein